MIRVEALTRNYGDLKAVDDVSFEISQGEIVGLLGHNGAGKTTIMKMLTGYLEPTGGGIEIDGLDIASQRTEVQQRIGYLPENDPLYPEMSVIDYLDYAASLHGVPETDRPARIRRAIERTELTDKALTPIGTLSRGYRQRVGVAQAILHQPRLLILDEPTNGLDPTQVQHMRGLIRSLAKDATVILSTHILPEVQAICDRVIIIRDGHKALDARLDELQAGRSLQLVIDAEAGEVQEALQAINGIDAIEAVSSDLPGQRYRLDLVDGADPWDVAPAVAKWVTQSGWRLFSLHPEQRSLEEIFAEISAADGRVLQ